MVASLSRPRARREAVTSEEFATQKRDNRPHEFLFSVSGVTERMVFDMRAHPELVEALISDPGANRGKAEVNQ